MKIRTNKINYSLNVENILARYDVFYIKYKGQVLMNFTRFLIRITTSHWLM